MDQSVEWVRELTCQIRRFRSVISITNSTTNMSGQSSGSGSQRAKPARGSAELRIRMRFVTGMWFREGRGPGGLRIRHSRAVCSVCLPDKHAGSAVLPETAPIWSRLLAFVGPEGTLSGSAGTLGLENAPPSSRLLGFVCPAGMLGPENAPLSSRLLGFVCPAGTLGWENAPL